MCGCMRVYAYRIDRPNQRAHIDQHSHRFHVPMRTREYQRCATGLPSQPASVRRSGAAAATQPTVHSWVVCTCAHALCVRLSKIMCVNLCAALDYIRLESAGQTSFEGKIPLH
jgi:hypothetical protein